MEYNKFLDEKLGIFQPDEKELDELAIIIAEIAISNEEIRGMLSVSFDKLESGNHVEIAKEVLDIAKKNEKIANVLASVDELHEYDEKDFDLLRARLEKL